MSNNPVVIKCYSDGIDFLYIDTDLVHFAFFRSQGMIYSADHTSVDGSSFPVGRIGVDRLASCINTLLQSIPKYDTGFTICLPIEMMDEMDEVYRRAYEFMCEHEDLDDDWDWCPEDFDAYCDGDYDDIHGWNGETDTPVAA